MQNTQNTQNELQLTESLEAKVKQLEEALVGGMQMRTHESKKNAAIGAIAVSMAKKNKDPLYELLKRHRTAWKRAKDEIVLRYRSQAEMKFQRKQSGM